MRSKSVVMVVDVTQTIDVVDTADVGGRHGAEGPCRLQVVAVIQGGWRGSRPVGETCGPHAGSHEVQLGDPREGDRGEVTLKLVDGLLRGGRLAHLRQAVEIKLVGVPLAVDFGHDVFVVIVAQRPAQLIVVHVGFAFAFPPAPSHLVRVDELELAVGSLPRDARHVGAVGEKLQQELPQLNLTASFLYSCIYWTPRCSFAFFQKIFCRILKFKPVFGGKNKQENKTSAPLKELQIKRGKLN